MFMCHSYLHGNYRLQIEGYSTQSLCSYYRTMSIALIVQIAVVIRWGNDMMVA